MTVLIVGADRLGNIPDKLCQKGVHKIIHWSGRNKSFSNRNIPKGVDQVIVFCDFINHNLMQNIKRRAKTEGIPLVYNKRSVSGLFS